ncbi:MAG TPA: benzoate-CoA ligase family protein [Thermoanaerobaculia bacterium]|jgi:2-aminobenzoate-CoA ligase|nr:benzoate-CoA ligase family protein [Thermoanaerobaculia bacterium]
MISAYTAHADPFVRENLPAAEDRPDFLFTLPDLQYPERLNATTAFIDSHVAAGHGGRPCLISPFERWSYRDLQSRVDRIARVLVERLGLVPGGRVLLRAPNTPMLAAAHLAVWKAGGVVVATMPLLRAKELSILIGKARIALALCDGRLLAELEKAREVAPLLERIVSFGHGPSESTGELESLMAEVASNPFPACDTAADDPCLVGFTSGTTGEPKGTIHNHRDLLATCDSYGKHVLHAQENDIFIGSPPLAFTFGLGGLLLFPLRVGASTVLLERATPDELLPAIARHRATICFTAPTAYRVMLGKLAEHDISCLRIGVSAGETLPKAIWDAWYSATGIELMDGIGSTEMLHIFIGSPQGEIRPGATGRAVPGYEAKVVDEEGNEVPPGTVGRLAVRGPTGCRYLADDRQKAYVHNGWNFTGDSYSMDEDGYFWYQARSDDMIVSSGYNIAGPEVEAALLSHPAVAECGVVGAPDPERGQIVKAYVVLRPDQEGEPGLVRALQDHVKAEIAPYKYPRAVAFVESLPRTGSGKLQRFRLREMARAEGKNS